ncbi:MAG TPA: NADH-quinone oxidoreductase subunit M [Cyclobacteriaceae bacterium]|nr:NADH-quinone oxidoreductase subunit M [Cyclobacteriaceae bacterium]
MSQYLLTALIFTPVAAALLGLFIPDTSKSSFRTLTLVISAIQIALLVFVIAQTRGSSFSAILLSEKVTWFSLDLGEWGVLQAEYFVGMDGLSFSMVTLTVLVMSIAGISSWTIDKNVKGYFILLWILNGAIVGTFVALDFLLFYLFFEFMLLPMYFLIGIWGGAKREYASIKFLLYTLLGSILILIVLIALYISMRNPEMPDQLVHTFNMLHMTDVLNYIPGSILNPAQPWIIGPQTARWWAFLFVLIGFAIKLPAVPFHTWLPDAHVEAPTPISVILAALLLKVGAYGLLRIAYPIFPDVATTLSWFVALIGVISIVYGALNALASKDLKRLIAYSSVSHMGFVMLGLASVTTEGVSGAVYQLFSHGIISAMLFLIAGVLYDRTLDRTIINYSGLSSKMPVYFTVVLITFFASLGLPGFSGFIAEIMVLLGAFRSFSANGLIHESFAIVATLGLILGAAYYLWTLQRMFFGPFYMKSEIKPDQLIDLDKREYSMFLPLILLALLFGIFPQILLDYINPFAQHFTESVLQTARSLQTP